MRNAKLITIVSLISLPYACQAGNICPGGSKHDKGQSCSSDNDGKHGSLGSSDLGPPTPPEGVNVYFADTIHQCCDEYLAALRTSTPPRPATGIATQGWCLHMLEGTGSSYTTLCQRVGQKHQELVECACKDSKICETVFEGPDIKASDHKTPSHVQCVDPTRPRKHTEEVVVDKSEGVSEISGEIQMAGHRSGLGAEIKQLGQATCSGENLKSHRAYDGGRNTHTRRKNTITMYEEVNNRYGYPWTRIIGTDENKGFGVWATFELSRRKRRIICHMAGGYAARLVMGAIYFNQRTRLQRSHTIHYDNLIEDTLPNTSAEMIRVYSHRHHPAGVLSSGYYKQAQIRRS